MAREATHPLFRLFRSEQFDNQAKRVLGHSIYHGALPGEVFSVLPRIKNGDFESWYRHWSVVAEQTVALAQRSGDAVSRGRALLRAANYFRSAMFFLPPTDSRTGEIYARSMLAFQSALSELRIPHQIHFVDYGKGRMRAYYFAGKSDGPMFLVHGGFDSTNEEGYLLIAAPLIERGYPVLVFEGPGQSSMARDYNIPFTVDWHRPIGAILDFVQRDLPDIAASRKVLVGISLGGLDDAAHDLDGAVRLRGDRYVRGRTGGVGCENGKKGEKRDANEWETIFSEESELRKRRGSSLGWQPHQHAREATAENGECHNS